MVVRWAFLNSGGFQVGVLVPMPESVFDIIKPEKHVDCCSMSYICPKNEHFFIFFYQNFIIFYIFVWFFLDFLMFCSIFYDFISLFCCILTFWTFLLLLGRLFFEFNVLVCSNLKYFLEVKTNKSFRLPFKTFDQSTPGPRS